MHGETDCTLHVYMATFVTFRNFAREVVMEKEKM